MLQRRIILEVLKFLSASDILHNTILVSCLYSSFSTNEELWRELLSQTPFSAHIPGVSSQEQYRRLSAHRIPLCTSSHVHLFHPLTETWSSIQLSCFVQSSQSISMVLTSSRHLFVTGSISPSTFTVDLATGFVSILKPLSIHRNSLGLIRCGEDIYAFCGFQGGYKNVCEVYREKKWNLLPKSHFARSAFNPCHRDGFVYLLGGCGATEAERFSLASQSFSDYPFHTPERLCTVATCIGGELFAFQKHGFYREAKTGEVYWSTFQSKAYFDRSFWSSFEVKEVAGVILILQLSFPRVVLLHYSTSACKMFPHSF